MTLLRVLDLVGVAVFAVSGAIAAGRRGLDLLGVLVLGLVTAIGGGTIRDVLLDRHPIFWLADPAYLYTIVAAVLATVAYSRWRPPPEATLGIADALGLALFSVAGAQIAERAGLPAAAGVVLGTVTGSAGGAVRDVLCAEVPMVLRRGSLYASAAIVGTSLYFILERAGIDRDEATYAGMAAVAALRLAAIWWRLQLPVFRLEAHESATIPGARTASVRVEHTDEFALPAVSTAARRLDFTTNLRLALAAARAAAARLGHDGVTPDHLLLGLVTLPQSTAGTLMRALGVDLEDVCREVERQLTARPAREHAELPYTGRATQVLDLAVDEATAAGDGYTGTGHLVLGLLREGRSVAARALGARGVTLEGARGARRAVPGDGR